MSDFSFSSDTTVEARLYAEALVRTVQEPLLVLTGDLTVESANPAFYRIFQVEPRNTVGSHLYDLGNGQWSIPELRRLLEEILPQRTSIEGYRVDHEFKQIGRRVLVLNANRIAREERHKDRILLSIFDITELEARREFAEKIVDAVRDPLLVLDWDLRVKKANQPFYTTFKADPADTEGRLIYDLGNGQWNILQLRHLLENVLPGNNAFNDYQVEHNFERIGNRIMVLNGRRLNHQPLILLAIEDITERMLAERRHKVFMAELQHRIKNILTNVQALARQTRQGSRTLRQFTKTFDARLQSLAHAQDLLLRNPGNVVSLEALIRDELDAVGAKEGRQFMLAGPEVFLAPRTTQAMAMTVHELTTNAVKYGALAVKRGRIAIAWHTEVKDHTKHLRLHWRESGIELQNHPFKKGFGMQIIERSLPHIFGGTATLTVHPDGAECLLEFPLKDEKDE